MAKYDGPSFYKNDHPKIAPINPGTANKKQSNTNYRLPEMVKEGKTSQKEERPSRQTPSQQLTKDPPPERFPFKRTHVPASLQRLDGWAKQQTANPLFIEIQERLQQDDFLLFEEFLSDEMKEKMENTTVVPVHTPSVVKEKAIVVQKEITKSLMKPGTGLHRSLSNIMDDEQKTISKNQTSLNRLFRTEENEKKR